VIEREKLAADNPEVLEYNIELANAVLNMGAVLSDTDDADEGVKYFDRALELISKILAVDPRHAHTLDMRFLTHLGKARALTAQRSADAIRAYDRVVEFSPREKNRRMMAERAMAVILVGRVSEGLNSIEALLADKPADPMEWYNHGCAFAAACVVESDKKETHGKRAVELLRKAADLGFRDATHWKLDKDLDPLRGRDDFKKLLAELEAKFPPKKEALPPPRADK
jgi:tetratricopeptide (TPR) repeat protein